MFFYLSKILWALVSPSNLFVLAFLVAAVLLRRRLRAFGRTLLAIVVVVLLAVSYLPVGLLLLRVLEDRFPRADLKDVHPAAIIVLGGPVDPTLSAGRGEVHLLDGAERLTAGVALSRTYPEVPLIYTGGSNAVLLPEQSEAAWARRLWLDLGVKPERIVTEERSRNTAENAAFLRDLLHPAAGARYILVTSAFHMPRSVGLFRKAGFDVLPYPVDYRTADRPTDYLPFTQASQGLGTLDFAVHEWVGLFVYYLSGKIDAPLPAPR